MGHSNSTVESPDERTPLVLQPQDQTVKTISNTLSVTSLNVDSSFRAGLKCSDDEVQITTDNLTTVLAVNDSATESSSSDEGSHSSLDGSSETNKLLKHSEGKYSDQWQYNSITETREMLEDAEYASVYFYGAILIASSRGARISRCRGDRLTNQVEIHKYFYEKINVASMRAQRLSLIKAKRVANQEKNMM